MSLVAEVVVDRYGIPIAVAQSNASGRRALADLHLVAAHVELLIPAGEDWSVNVDRSYPRVEIETTTGFRETAERARIVLQAAIEKAGL